MKRVLEKVNYFCATGFGSGLVPWAPGTWGTLAALPIVWVLSLLPVWLQGALLFAGFVYGIYICAQASKALGKHDAPSVVWDEIIGFAIAMFLIPLNWQTLVAGFVLFRLFDIFKPWPISYLDKQIKGGLGVMLDDVLAGVLTWLVLQLFLLYMM